MAVNLLKQGHKLYTKHANTCQDTTCQTYMNKKQESNMSVDFLKQGQKLAQQRYMFEHVSRPPESSNYLLLHRTAPPTSGWFPMQSKMSGSLQRIMDRPGLRLRKRADKISFKKTQDASISDFLADITSDILSDVAVRQGRLEVAARGWGPAGNTLRPGQEHLLAIEGTLDMSARGWGLARNTGHGARGWGSAGNTGRGWGPARNTGRGCSR